LKDKAEDKPGIGTGSDTHSEKDNDIDTSSWGCHQHRTLLDHGTESNLEINRNWPVWRQPAQQAPVWEQAAYYKGAMRVCHSPT